jgi:hypothetical protein
MRRKATPAVPDPKVRGIKIDWGMYGHFFKYFYAVDTVRAFGH